MIQSEHAMERGGAAINWPISLVFVHHSLSLYTIPTSYLPVDPPAPQNRPANVRKPASPPTSDHNHHPAPHLAHITQFLTNRSDPTHSPQIHIPSRSSPPHLQKSSKPQPISQSSRIFPLHRAHLRVRVPAKPKLPAIDVFTPPPPPSLHLQAQHHHLLNLTLQFPRTHKPKQPQRWYSTTRNGISKPSSLSPLPHSPSFPEPLLTPPRNRALRRLGHRSPPQRRQTQFHQRHATKKTHRPRPPPPTNHPLHHRNRHEHPPPLQTRPSPLPVLQHLPPIPRRSRHGRANGNDFRTRFLRAAGS